MKTVLIPETRADVVALFLRDLLERCGLKQGELAAKLGVAQSSVSRFLNGQALPTLLALHQGLSMAEWQELLERLDTFVREHPEAL